MREYRASLSNEEGEKLFSGGAADTFCIELEGFKAQAICLAVFESSWHQQPGSLREIERCELEGFQAGINEALDII